MKAAPVVNPARDARLIADHNDWNPKPVTARDGLARTGVYAHILGAAKISGVFDKDAIAVEKEGGPTGRPLTCGINLAPEAGIRSFEWSWDDEAFNIAFS